MKLSEIYDLTEILSTFYDKTLPARASFSIVKFLSQTKEDLKLYLEKKEELILKYSYQTISKNDNEIQFKIKEDKISTLEKEMKDLDEIQVDVKLVLYYEDLESLFLTPREVMKLLPYLV